MYKYKQKNNCLTDRICRIVLGAFAVLVFSTLFNGLPSVFAQARHSIGKRATAGSTRHGRLRRKVVKSKTAPEIAQPAKGIKSLAPVSVVNLVEPDFLSGEASVAVNPKQPTVIRLGLAQNAVSIVEFPASDGIYYIHEGNPKLASVFQSPTKETDRSITIYPGEAFLSQREGASAVPSAAITLQMRSGLVLILELVPVGDIRKNAHRCVINYNREEVIAARRSAGLAYDLGEEVKTVPSRNTKAASKLVGGSQPLQEEEASTSKGSSTEVPIRSASIDIIKRAGRKDGNNASSVSKSGADLSMLANKKLADCLKNPKKQLGSWSQTNSGLTLAVSQITEIDSDQRLVVVAVRNDTAGNLRLIPGSPEFQVQTSDSQDNALQTERLERLYVETTSLEGMILPGSTVYYALVYKAPIIGVNQRVRILVSHREAADSPVAVSLPTANSEKE